MNTMMAEQMGLMNQDATMEEIPAFGSQEVSPLHLARGYYGDRFVGQVSNVLIEQRAETVWGME